MQIDSLLIKCTTRVRVIKTLIWPYDYDPDKPT